MRRLLLSLILFVAIFCPIGGQVFADESCDDAFADQIEERALEEAEREVAVATTLILKPDSVLDYTCFDNVTEEFAKATVFGNNQPKDDYGNYWLQEYRKEILDAADFNCMSMQAVWKDARCKDVEKGVFFQDLGVTAGGGSGC